MSGGAPRGSSLDLFDLSGCAALVTGATGALGGSAARALAGAGAGVALAGGNVEKLAELEVDLEAHDVVTTRIECRPQTQSDAGAMVSAVVDAFGRLDIVVLSAGINIVAPTAQMTDDEFNAVMGANVHGSWLVAQAAGRQMLKQAEGGRIILVSSTRGRLGHPAGYSAYCASKSAVEGLTRALACEWGPSGITVNAIGPTVFRSDLTAWMYADDGPGREVREAMLSRIPLGRLGEPDDFAGAIVFLASGAASFVTGQVLYIDGGYTAG